MQNGPESFPFDSAERIRPIPQQRVMEKVDALMAKRDYPGVERTLLFWLAEAQAGHDRRGELMVRSELVGHYRKTGEAAKAHACADEALRLLRETGYEGSLTDATTRVNIGTALNAFGENEEAFAMFEEARRIMETSPACSPSLLGGLYNNMGLVLTALKRPGEALALYEKAMAQMAKAPNGEIEQAVTCLNMANAVELRDGAEEGEPEINALLDKAEDLLRTPSLPHDGYYAYVCEKCAPTFEYYGSFRTAQDLREKAESIYERA